MCRSPEGYGNIASTNLRGRVSSAPPARNVSLSAQYSCHLAWMACTDGASSMASAEEDRFSDNERPISESGLHRFSELQKSGSSQFIGSPAAPGFRELRAEGRQRGARFRSDLLDLRSRLRAPGDPAACPDECASGFDQD